MSDHDKAGTAEDNRRQRVEIRGPQTLGTPRQANLPSPTAPPLHGHLMGLYLHSNFAKCYCFFFKENIIIQSQGITIQSQDITEHVNYDDLYACNDYDGLYTREMSDGDIQCYMTPGT
jgi:hypothetical protein